MALDYRRETIASADELSKTLFQLRENNRVGITISPDGRIEVLAENQAPAAAFPSRLRPIRGAARSARSASIDTISRISGPYIGASRMSL